MLNLTEEPPAKSTILGEMSEYLLNIIQFTTVLKKHAIKYLCPKVKVQMSNEPSLPFQSHISALLFVCTLILGI